MAVTVYGIKNCDTMKKAFAWLGEHDVAYDFHDYKKLGIGQEHLAGWCRSAGWEMLLNKAGTTFRKLPDAEKQDMDEAKAIRLMAANPSMIKRPVMDVDGALVVGFKPESYGNTLL